MRRLLLSLLALTLVGTPVARASVTPPAVAYGNDISWPNCPIGVGDRSLGLPMPASTAHFVVVGLTNGPGFTRNPCLASQVRWAKTRHKWLAAYAVLSYPTPAQLSAYGGAGSATTRLYRTGVAQANRNVAAMRKAGLSTPVLWVDVEPVKLAPWSRSTTGNNAVLNGAVAAYKAAGLRVGFYSYAYGWKEITGGRRLAAYPTWVPSGGATRASAAARCSRTSFSGGPVAMGQWTYAQRDHNVTCGGVARSMRSWFAST